MKMQRLSALTIAIATLAAACGGGSDSSSPEVILEARWQCDVQRQTFADLGTLDIELDTRLLEAGLTRSEYDSFKEELGLSTELRSQVADEFEAYCRP